MNKTVEIEHEELASSFVYLDGLRLSGKTNMIGASVFLMSELGLSQRKSREILKMWMMSFDPKKSIDERIELALK